MPSTSPRPIFITWLGSGILLAMLLLAYTPAMQGDFIWDDSFNIIDNSLLRTLEGLRKIWVAPYSSPQYYPLMYTSFWIEYRLWGLHSFGYHLLNVVLHACNAILLWRLLQRLQIRGAWMAAAIFALHPVHVESVAWITERKNVLSGLFYLVALLVYIRFAQLDAKQHEILPDAQQQPCFWFRNRAYLLALGLFCCALLSKTVTCSLPAVILLLLWWKRERITWPDLRAVMPMFLIGFVLAMITSLSERHYGAFGKAWELSFVDRCLVAGRAIWFYVSKLVWPHNMTFNYPRWQIDAGIWQQYLYPLTILAVVAAMWLLRKRIGKVPLLAILYFIGTLTPALGFFNVFYMRYSFVADHFQYLASISLITFGVAGLSLLFKQIGSSGKSIQYALCAGLLLILALRVWHEGDKYQDMETLWRDTIVKNPDSKLAHYNLGVLLAEQGNFKEATQHYAETLRIEPDNAQAHHNWGVALAMQGQFEEAIRHYAAALRIDPWNAYTYNSLGIALMTQGNCTEAIQQYSQALKIDPRYAEAHNNLGVALAMQGNFKEALRHYAEALWIAPNYLKAQNNLAHLLLTIPENFVQAIDFVRAWEMQGDKAKAMFLYKQIREFQPNSVNRISNHLP